MSRGWYRATYWWHTGRYSLSCAHIWNFVYGKQPQHFENGRRHQIFWKQKTISNSFKQFFCNGKTSISFEKKKDDKIVCNGRQSWLPNLTWPELGTAQRQLVLTFYYLPMRQNQGDSLLCLASHIIKPKWGRKGICLGNICLPGFSIARRWFLRHACHVWDYSHVWCKGFYFLFVQMLHYYRKQRQLEKTPSKTRRWSRLKPIVMVDHKNW